jgi:hypothetical protein
MTDDRQTYMRRFRRAAQYLADLEGRCAAGRRKMLPDDAAPYMAVAIYATLSLRHAQLRRADENRWLMQPPKSGLDPALGTAMAAVNKYALKHGCSFSKSEYGSLSKMCAYMSRAIADTCTK